MEGNYAVFFGREQVGKVQVLKQGLYYRFTCRCRLTGDVVCRLTVSCEDKQENLGIVVPIGDGFGLDTKLPVKRLGNGMMKFQLHPKHEIEIEKFTPIYPEEPFAYIARLKDSFLVRKNGQAGILIK